MSISRYWRRRAFPTVRNGQDQLADIHQGLWTCVESSRAGKLCLSQILQDEKSGLPSFTYELYCRWQRGPFPLLARLRESDRKEQLYKIMMSEASAPDPLVEQAIRKIKGTAYLQLLL